MNLPRFSLILTLLLMFLLPSVAIGAFATVPSVGNTTASSTNAASFSTCSTAPGSIFPYSQGFVFNPLNKFTYVYYAYSSSSTIKVFKGTCSLVTTINYPNSQIYTAAFSPINGFVYVYINARVPYILLYKGTTLFSRINSISLPGIRISSFLSLTSGSVYFPSGNGSSTAVPLGQVADVMGNMSGQNSAFSPSTGEVYSINGFGGGDYVRIYGVACSCLKTHITIAPHTGGIIYVPRNSNMYVTSYYSTGTRNATGVVTVISTITKHVVLVIGVGRHAMDVSYSPKTGDVYATNLDPFNGITSVSIINGLSVAKTLAIKGNPDVIAYNPFDGLMYVTLVKANYIAEISA
jgi:hypothetical protein